MKLFVPIFAALLLLGATAFAQIVIHNTDFSPIGYSYTWGRATPATFSVGSAGANQTWTFGSYTWASGEQRTYVTASTTPHGSSYPSATRAEHILPNFGGEIESYEYQQVTASTYMQLGQVYGDSVIVYNPPMENGPLPMSYNMQWHTLMRYGIQMDTITMTFQDSLSYSADGWGNITTPYGTWPVLRMFVHHWITVSLMNIPYQSYQMVSYTWVNQQGNSVVVVTSNQNITDPNFTTGTISMMGVALSAEPPRVPLAKEFTVGQNYPNPFNPTTEIPVTLSNSGRVNLDIYDVLGQIVSHEQPFLPAGSHQIMVNGSRWTSGLYFARVSAGEQQRVIKLNLLK